MRVLLDANLFMYAAGAPHPHKGPSAEFLRCVARGEVDAACDAEVLQEILRRYRAILRWEEGRRVYDLARRIVPLVLAIDAVIVDRARHLLDEIAGLSARDALHAAVAIHHQFPIICSYDEDFDRVPGIERWEPPAEPAPDS